MADAVRRDPNEYHVPNKASIARIITAADKIEGEVSLLALFG